MNRYDKDKCPISTFSCIAHLSHKTSVHLVVTVIYSAIMVQQCWGAANAASQIGDITDTENSEVEYNAGFIRGSGVDITKYTKGNATQPGVYSVFVIVNGENHGRHDINFGAVEGKVSAQPLFTLSELFSYGIQPFDAGKNKPDTHSKKRVMLNSVIPGSKVNYNGGDFELYLQVPQASLVRNPRGYIDPARWQSGATVGFIDYNANLYDSRSSEDKENYSGNLGMSLGINFNEWLLRRRMNTSWSQNDGTSTQNLYTYLQRDITSLKSRLRIGDANTSGDLFDSFNLRGVLLESDDRMLPEGLRNYVPVLRGIADTNAKVTVTQHGQKIYETVVPPGEFELDDIGAMGYGGDLQLTVTEADGRQRIQNIPFSAPPMLIHEAISRLSLYLGELNDDSIKGSPNIFQAFYQYGLTNNYTAYAGGQLAEHYRAVAAGNAINTPIGGFSLDITHALTKLNGGKNSSGNSVNIGYTKYLQETSTNMTLAAYRYSSKGYYSFRDASIERYGSNSIQGADYRTKERFTANLSQSLIYDSSLMLSTSIYNYWDNRKPGRQYSASFNKSHRYFSYSLTAMRTDNGMGDYDDSLMLSVSVPLGGSTTRQPLFNSLYSSFTNDDSGRNTLQMSATGSQGDQNQLNYGVGSSIATESGEKHQESINGNIDYRSRYGQFGLTASADNASARQISLSANGSVVAHRGGVTLGSTLADSPFAIINAQGADGAKVLNGYGSRIDANGYAISPSLTPYRENSVGIDPKGLPGTVDVMDGEQVVVPRAGAAIEVNMKTVVGVPMILIVRDEQNAFLPIGTQIVDELGTGQSLIGQGGMAFIRGWDPAKSAIFALIGQKKRCRIVPDPKHIAASGVINGRIEQRKMVCIRQP